MCKRDWIARRHKLYVDKMHCQQLIKNLHDQINKICNGKFCTTFNYYALG